MKPSLNIVLLALTLWLGSSCEALRADKPDLVLLVTVDQLRGDMPLRGRERFGPNGFRYLFEQGTWYPNAHFSHLVTTTAAGHATLATGTSTPWHGIAANDWYDRSTRRKVYNTEDRNYPLLGVSAAPEEGRSPRNLLAATFGDELVKASGGNSRVFSVSLKDRGAILPAGKLGKAFWYSKYTGRFVTSTYYYPNSPGWMTAWNQAGHADRFRDRHWELLLDREQYVYGDQDMRSFEKPKDGLGMTFPHALSNPDDASFYSALRATPMGDELTLSFLKALFDAENIGGQEDTDILAVSFSATDYIGHDFGPDSLEAEDNLLRLDRTLQALFEFIDDRVGLDQTLVVLSADHGIAPSPQRMKNLGVGADWHWPERILKTANEVLKSSFPVEENLALAFLKPGIYLDESRIEKAGLNLAEVERVLADGILSIPGLSAAYSRTDLLTGDLPQSGLVSLATDSVHPVRSGNVILVQDPFWLLSSDPEDDASTHSSPYAYDTHVPIMLAGPGIRGQRINTRVAPRDVAPTICRFLGIPPPAAATGRLLPGLFPE